MDQPGGRLNLEQTGCNWRLGTGGPVNGRPVRWRLPLVPVVICFALAVAACGGGSPTAGVANIATTTTVEPAGGVVTRGGPSNVDLAKYGRCMRSHGILNFPDPASPGAANALRDMKESGAMSSPEFQSAAQACEKYAPPQRPAPQITAQAQADYLKAARCMRSHGVVGFPDPVVSGAQVTFPIPASMDTKSPQFLRAREICELLIPAGLPYSKGS